MKRRVGILGHGYMGRIRRAALGRRSDAELVRIAEDERSDWREVVADPNVDCVFVCLPNHLTCEAVCRALEAGKHVLAEKPPGTSSDQVRRMAEAEAASGRTLKFGFNHRHHPAVLVAERTVREGNLGEVVWMRGVYGKPWSSDFEAGWRARLALAGGGILMDQGIHLLDVMRALTGGFERVQAVASRTLSREVEDDVMAVLQARSGAVATLHSSHTLHQARFSLELGLTAGTITLEGLATPSGRYGPERLTWRSAQSGHDQTATFADDRSWDIELDEFFTAAGGAAPISVGSTAEALATMILVEAIYAAAGLNRWSSSNNS